MTATQTISRSSARAAPGSPRTDRRVVAAALLFLAGGTAAAFDAAGARMAVLFLLGGGLGVALYHAAFGFTGSWRAFLADGRGAGLRAQMAMLALASAIFLPILDAGGILGQGVVGAVAPVGISVGVGAFLFGVGMQLAGACASGTLFALGGGSTRMLVTLAFFLIGSLLGSLHMPWWLDTPSVGAISLLRELGLWGALALQWAVFAAIALLSIHVERRRHGRLLATTAGTGFAWRRVVAGPWPMIIGGLALALMNAATLAIAGHPWNISFGYTLWGAKAAAGLGLDVQSWAFWTWSYPKQALEGPLLAETTSTMNFGIIAGALLAAGLAGRFAPARRVPWKAALAAAIGGLLMGYGARLAFGCNIGAFFSGIASGSVHGWLWLLAALPGNWLGVKLRPLFDMAVARRA